jgi:hypothetical protein
VSDSGPFARGSVGAVAASAAAFAARAGSGETNLQLTEPLLWVMLGISVAGALVTFAFLVYAVWKFRDPRMKGRRHG